MLWHKATATHIAKLCPATHAGQAHPRAGSPKNHQIRREVDMALTAKQERFVEEYLVSLNATDAARKAGYAHPTTQGPRLLENVGVARAISAAQAKRSERVEVSQDYVLSSIIETMERCKQASPVLDRGGNPVMVETPSGQMLPAYTFNSKDVLKGAELLGRHLGMFGGDGSGNDDAPALNINITSDAPVKDVRVTRSER